MRQRASSASRCTCRSLSCSRRASSSPSNFSTSRTSPCSASLTSGSASPTCRALPRTVICVGPIAGSSRGTRMNTPVARSMAARTSPRSLARNCACFAVQLSSFVTSTRSARSARMPAFAASSALAGPHSFTSFARVWISTPKRSCSSRACSPPLPTSVPICSAGTSSAASSYSAYFAPSASSRAFSAVTFSSGPCSAKLCDFARQRTSTPSCFASLSIALARSSLALRNAFSGTSTTAFSRVYASSSAASFVIAASHRLASPSTHTHPSSSTWISTFSSFSSSRRVAPFTPTRHGNASSGAAFSSFTVCSFTHASIAAVAAATFSAAPPTHSSSFSSSSATWNWLRTLEMCLPFVPTNTPPTRAGIAILASTMPASAFSTSSFAFAMSS